MIVIINKKQNINKDENVHRYEERGEKVKLVVKIDQRCIFKIIVYRRHLTCTKTTLAY